MPERDEHGRHRLDEAGGTAHVHRRLGGRCGAEVGEPQPPGRSFRPRWRLAGEHDVDARVGREVVERTWEMRHGLEFIGETNTRLWAAALNPRLWRPISIARHVYDTGITAIPIVSLIAFFATGGFRNGWRALY